MDADMGMEMDKSVDPYLDNRDFAQQQDQESELRAASQKLDISMSGSKPTVLSSGNEFEQLAQDSVTPIEVHNGVDYQMAFDGFLLILAVVFGTLAIKYSVRKDIWSKRKTRLITVAAVVWTAFVFLRSVDSYELLGYYLEAWDEDNLLQNWLFPPAVITAGIYGYRWVSAGAR